VDKVRRHTRQLEVVWDSIKDDTSHPTADQIYERVRGVIPKISLGTVYRNLQKLVAQGKLQVLIIDRTQRFDPLVDRHQHFICKKCGRVYDVFVRSKKEITPSSPPPEGFTVTSHEVSFYGTCSDCSARLGS